MRQRVAPKAHPNSDYLFHNNTTNAVFSCRPNQYLSMHWYNIRTLEYLKTKHLHLWEVVITKAAAFSSHLVWINKGRKHEAPNQTSANAELRSLNFFLHNLDFEEEEKKKVLYAISDNCFCCERVMSCEFCIVFPFTVKNMSDTVPMCVSDFLDFNWNHHAE